MNKTPLFIRRFLIGITCVLACILHNACVGVSSSLRDVDYSTKLAEPQFPVEGRAIKGVALVVHGLNFKPERMDDWAQILRRHGVVTFRLTLFGHDSETRMQHATADIWRTQLDANVKAAQSLAAQLGVPVFYLGYSLGGLLGVDYLARRQNNDARFDKMVLLAPAIATPWYSDLSKAVINALNKELIVRTPNPSRFRAVTGASVNAYAALFDIKAEVEKANFANANVATLVVVDRNDELTPFADIRQIAKLHHLSRWQLEPVNNIYAKTNHGFRHLIADRESVGPKLWHEITKRVISHLQI